MNLRVGAGTDIGRRRQQNQDSLTCAPELNLYLVADGMGGHRGGETASAIAAERIPEYIKEHAALLRREPGRVLTEAIQSASSAILLRSTHEAALQGMGTTVSAALFAENKAYIGHVGDSRCYLIRPHTNEHEGELWQITRDHSLVQEKLRAGLITREQVKTDRMKNVITRSVGFERAVAVDVYEYTPSPGDLFLICSDGLSGLVEDEEILAVVEKNLAVLAVESANQVTGTVTVTVTRTPNPLGATEGAPEGAPETPPPLPEHSNDFIIPPPTPASSTAALQAAVNELIARANSNGGDDNITAILIQIP